MKRKKPRALYNVSGICHNGYMENLFANVINEEVIDNLTNEQVDMLLEMLKDV